jgi:hypothetical protein
MVHEKDTKKAYLNAKYYLLSICIVTYMNKQTQNIRLDDNIVVVSVQSCGMSDKKTILQS